MTMWAQKERKYNNHLLDSGLSAEMPKHTFSTKPKKHKKKES